MIPDVHGALCAAIVGLFHPARAEIRSSSQRRWSSVTFSGARHRCELCVSGDRANELVDHATAAVMGGDFAFEGHVVADIAVMDRRSPSHDRVEIEFEALTVEAY